MVWPGGAAGREGLVPGRLGSPTPSALEAERLTPGASQSAPAAGL